jgi:ribosomal protein S12 methylthiotransferase accessory factor
MGIHYQGREIEEAKLPGSHRASSLKLEDLRPHFRRLGITRLGNITNLDRIGIPVTIVTRPNSPTISINSGKGLTMEDAEISGAMEAIEIAVAENATIKSFRASYDDLAGHIGVIPKNRLALTDASIFHPSLPLQWTPCWDLISGKHVAVPRESIGMRITSCYSMLLAFQVGSNGLASGGTFLEAIASGLAEVIERDAWTCRQNMLMKCGIQYPRVALETILNPEVNGLVSQIREAGVELFLYDVTCDIDVPVYGAMLVDREDRDAGVFLGYGCHLDPSIAMIRAITEAAQGRCCYIAGARDDLFRRQFMVSRKQQCALEELESHPATVDASERKSQATETVHGDIEAMISHLKSAGLDQVLIADLSDPLIPASIVRVIVPGLEGHCFEFYAPGERAINHERELQSTAG